MYNKATLMGNLTRDVELRYLPSGAAVAKTAIATSYKYKSSAGEQKEEVMFIDVSIFGKIGEIANQYLKKGSKVLLDGRLVFEQWQSQTGENRSKHTLRVETLKMLDSKPQEQRNYNQNPPVEYQQQRPQQNQYSNMSEDYKNIPDVDIEEVPF